MPKIHPACVGAHAREHPSVISEQICGGPRPDSLRHHSFAVEFDDIFAAPCSDEAGESSRMAPLVAAFRSAACLRGACESLQFFCVVVVLSAFSFGFIAFFFGIFIRLERSHLSDSGVDIGNWTACPTNADVTRLGQVLSYSTVRAQVSLPKHYEVALMATLISYLCAQSCVVACQVGLFGFALAVIATPLYLHPSCVGSDALPNFVDPIFSMSMTLAMVGRLSWSCIRARASTVGLASRYPGIVFAVCITATFTFNSIVVNLSPAAMGLTPTAVVTIGYIIARGVGLLARLCIKGIELPLLGSWSIFFAYDVSVATALRRYMIGLIDGDTAMAAILATAVVELLLNGMSVVLAVLTFNNLLPRSQEDATVHMNLFFASMVSDMLSEQIALHSCLGYALFADPLIFNIGEKRSASVIVRNWVMSTCVEWVVDGACIWGIILILPVSFRRMVARATNSTVMLVFAICATVHPHLIGLHNILDVRRYICDPNIG